MMTPMSDAPGGLPSALARAYDRYAPYWPVRQLLARWRWLLLRLRTEMHARGVGSRVRFQVDPTARIGRRAFIDVLPGTESRVVVGPKAWLGDDVQLQMGGGTISIGEDTTVRTGFRAVVGGDLRIGAGCLISWATSCHCTESVEIGDLTIVGEQSVITDSRHLRTAPGVPVFHHVRAEPTRLGKNCWLGASVVVGAGVTVGDQVFIGANSVVTKDVASGWFAAGAPAQPIRELDVESP